MQCGRLDQLRLKYKETAAGFTHPVSTHFTDGKFYSNVLLLSLVLSCTSLWPIMVIDPSRPPICSSLTHCQHLNSEMCRHRVYKNMSPLPSSTKEKPKYSGYGHCQRALGSGSWRLHSNNQAVYCSVLSSCPYTCWPKGRQGSAVNYPVFIWSNNLSKPNWSEKWNLEHATALTT